MENAKDRMIQAEKDYRLVKEDNEKLTEMVKFLSELKDRINPLQEYYFNDWMDDLLNLENEDFNNEVTNQDSIYEEIVDQYELVKDLLLECAKYINE
ncbi:MAG: DUF4298 domain-containing protein [Tissierellia bacterium]|nr:DUF4298 domain-containing protein [Tissierellia bacterium]